MKIKNISIFKRKQRHNQFPQQPCPHYRYGVSKFLLTKENNCVCHKWTLNCFKVIVLTLLMHIADKVTIT